MACYRIWCSDTWECDEETGEAFQSGRILAEIFDTKEQAEQEMQLVIKDFGDNCWYEVIEEDI